MKLLFDWTNFSEPLLFKDSYFFQSSYTFLQELLFQKMLFFGAANFLLLNLFSQLLSIYHLVINPTNTGVFRLKLPRGAQSRCTSQKIFLIITWQEQKFRIRFAFSEEHWTFGLFNENINFSTEILYSFL